MNYLSFSISQFRQVVVVGVAGISPELTRTDVVSYVYVVLLLALPELEFSCCCHFAASNSDLTRIYLGFVYYSAPIVVVQLFSAALFFLLFSLPGMVDKSESPP